MYRRELFAGLFSRGNLVLGRARCRRDERGAKVPVTPRALVKSHSRAQRQALIPFPQGFWPWGKVLTPLLLQQSQP